MGKGFSLWLYKKLTPHKKRGDNVNHFAAEDILLNNIRLENKMKRFFADIYDAKAQWKYWMMVYS